MFGGFKRLVIDINSLSYLPGVSSIGIRGELTHGEYEGVRSLSSNVNYTRQSAMEWRPEQCILFRICIRISLPPCQIIAHKLGD